MPAGLVLFFVCGHCFCMLIIMYISILLELIYSCRPLKDETTLNTLENVDIKMFYATVVKPGMKKHFAICCIIVFQYGN